MEKLRGRQRLAVLLAALTLCGAGIFGSALVYRAHRVDRMLSDARALARAAEWQKAKHLFGTYLLKRPGDGDVLAAKAAMQRRPERSAP